MADGYEFRTDNFTIFTYADGTTAIYHDAGNEDEGLFFKTALIDELAQLLIDVQNRPANGN